MAAALMMSAVGSFQEGQAEMLRLRLPQLLWKVSVLKKLCFVQTSLRLMHLTYFRSWCTCCKLRWRLSKVFIVPYFLFSPKGLQDSRRPTRLSVLGR